MLLITSRKKTELTTGFSNVEVIWQQGRFWSGSKKEWKGVFPGGPVVKNLPSDAGDAGSIPGRGTKIPHVARQLSLRATTREKPMCRNEISRVPQLRPDATKNNTYFFLKNKEWKGSEDSKNRQLLKYFAF